MVYISYTASGWFTHLALLVNGLHILHCWWMVHISRMAGGRFTNSALLVNVRHHELVNGLHILRLCDEWFALLAFLVDGTHHALRVNGSLILNCWWLVHLSCVTGG